MSKMLYTRRTVKSQIGSQAGYNQPFVEGGGDINFAVGQFIMLRVPLNIPRGATVNSATVTFNLVVKNAGTIQYSTHNVFAHLSPDSPKLVPGNNEDFRVINSTSTWFSTTFDWPVANPPDHVYDTLDIKNILQELVDQPNWVEGGYFTLIIQCTNENGSDMGIRANNDWLPPPEFTIEYTDPPLTDTTRDINLIENPHFDPGLDDMENYTFSDLPFWYQNPFFGGYAGPEPYYGTIQRDTTFTRKPGVPTLKYTTGEFETGTNKWAGFFSQPVVNGVEPLVFAGWLYVPTYIPTSTRVRAEFVYFGGYTEYDIKARGQWVPFCTRPYNWNDPGAATRYAAIGIRPYQPGWSIWLSEPAVINSPVQQMPFTGDTDDKTGITHQRISSSQRAIREYRALRWVHNGTGLRPVRSWTKNEYGLWVLHNPQPATRMLRYKDIDPALTPATLPEGKTYKEM